MSYIIICNTGSDTLSRFSIEEEKSYNFAFSAGEKPFGPHGICTYKNNLVTANSYNNTISIISKDTFEEINNIYVGPHPTDVAYVNGKIYSICRDGNCINIFNTKNNSMEYEIMVGNIPHSISVHENQKIGLITNMGEDSVVLFDFHSNRIIDKISTGKIPTKSIISKDGKYVYVIISNLGYDINGRILIFDLKSMDKVNEIQVGKGSVDAFEYCSKLYVSNFCDESISVVNLKNQTEEKRYIIKNSMPRGIIIKNDNIYFGDYYCGLLHIINLNTSKKKSIAIGKEPNAMILQEY